MYIDLHMHYTILLYCTRNCTLSCMHKCLWHLKWKRVVNISGISAFPLYVWGHEQRHTHCKGMGSPCEKTNSGISLIWKWNQNSLHSNLPILHALVKKLYEVFLRAVNIFFLLTVPQTGNSFTHTKWHNAHHPSMSNPTHVIIQAVM